MFGCVLVFCGVFMFCFLGALLFCWCVLVFVWYGWLVCVVVNLYCRAVPRSVVSRLVLSCHVLCASLSGMCMRFGVVCVCVSLSLCWSYRRV